MNKKKIYPYIQLSMMSLLMVACLLYQLATVTTVRANQPGLQNNVAAASPIGGCSLFPANNIWNTRVDGLPVHADSAGWVNSIGRNTGFHMDFGSGEWDGGPIGIPYNLVNGSAVTHY